MHPSALPVVMLRAATPTPFQYLSLKEAMGPHPRHSIDYIILK